jgi:hypothetical protein
MKGHTSRVGTLAWSSSMLASGSRDRSILVQDVRIRSSHPASPSSTQDSIHRGTISPSRSSLGSSSHIAPYLSSPIISRESSRQILDPDNDLQHFFDSITSSQRHLLDDHRTGSYSIPHRTPERPITNSLIHESSIDWLPSANDLLLGDTSEPADNRDRTQYSPTPRLSYVPSRRPPVISTANPVRSSTPVTGSSGLRTPPRSTVTINSIIPTDNPPLPLQVRVLGDLAANPSGYFNPIINIEFL